MTAHDRWKTTDPNEDNDELPEGHEEWTDKERREYDEYMAMSPARRRIYDSL